MRKGHGRIQTAALVVALILAPLLSACTPTELIEMFGGPRPSNETEYDAEIHNSQLQAGVDTTLSHIWNGEWEPPPTGNVRSTCTTEQGEPGYIFYGSWFTPETAGLPGEREVAESSMAGFRGWLESAGWSELEQFDFSESDSTGVNAYGVGGALPERGIAWMQAIYYYEGDVGIDYPHVVVDVDSSCLAIDQ